MSTTEAQLELNQHRTIVLTDRGRTYSLVCRRVTPDDWKKYFAATVLVSEQSGRERVNVIDVNSPRLALAEAVLVDAEGYKVAGDVPLVTLPNWQTRIPLAHRLQLGETLSDARASASEGDLTIYPEGEEVLLDATWSAIETPTGCAMQAFRGLKHVLKTPTEAQHRRYSSEASRSRIVGGSRSAKTYYAGAQTLLAQLYDELIVEVEGYSSNGSPLKGKEDIVREMDMLHKVMAAQELFQPQTTAQLAGAENQAE